VRVAAKVLVAVVAAALLSVLGWEFFYQRPFDRLVWLQDEESRPRMARNAGRRVVGKTLQEAERLLGPADPTCEYTTADTACWWAGNVFFGIDNRCFVLLLDGGRVSGWVMTDDDFPRSREELERQSRR
jgi:hypothetical protein